MPEPVCKYISELQKQIEKLIEIIHSIVICPKPEYEAIPEIYYKLTNQRSTKS